MKFYTYLIVIKKFDIRTRQGPQWNKIKGKVFVHSGEPYNNIPSILTTFYEILFINLSAEITTM